MNKSPNYKNTEKDVFNFTVQPTVSYEQFSFIVSQQIVLG